MRDEDAKSATRLQARAIVPVAPGSLETKSVPVQEGSKAFALDTVDLQKIGIGAAIAIGGALLTYVVTVVLPDLQNKDVISAGLFVLITTALNALQKFLRDKSDTLTRV